MAANENGNPRPDGFSLSWTPSIPGLGLLGIGGTYYWNPGSDTAPSLTLTGMYGRGRDVWRLGPPWLSGNAGFVFRRNGMTSADTLGYGTTSNASTVLPSVTVNTTIPDENGIPQPVKSRVSSVEAGISNSIGASTAGTYTATPQQTAEFFRYIRPAMGPQDELSPFARTLQSGVGTVGENTAPPVRFLGSRIQNPLGEGMAGWRSSVNSNDPQYLRDRDAALTPSIAPSDHENSLNGRFAKWGSAPATIAPPPASDGPESFDNRFGSWGSRPANGFGENSSPVLRFLEQYHSAVAPAAGGPSSDVPLSSPPAPALPAGEPQATVSDKPMRYLGRRVAGEPTVFDTGAQALPFAPSLAPLSPDGAPHDPAGDEQDRLWFLRGWR